MVLRGLIVALGMLVASAAQAEGDPVAYARALYQREIARNVSGAPMPAAAFDALFTPDVIALRNAPRSPAAPAMAGPKLHAFFGWGMLPGVPVTLRHVGGAATAGRAIVIVDLSVRGAPRTVFLHLHQVDQKWLISNVLYDQGDDLLTFYRRLSGQ
jgi:hypothetical protein